MLNNAADVLLLSVLHFQRAKMRNNYLWHEAMPCTFYSSPRVPFTGVFHGHVAYVNCLKKVKYCFDSGHSFLQDVLLGNYSYHVTFTLEQSLKVQRGCRSSSTLSLTLALDEGGWSLPNPDCFTHLPCTDLKSVACLGILLHILNIIVHIPFNKLITGVKKQ